MGTIEFWGITISGDVPLGDLIVGVGTLALAIVTWFLARRTGEEVELTRENVELTRESIEAVDRPFVVAAPERFELTPMFTRGEEEPSNVEWALFADLTNLGRGPAIFDGVVLENEDGSELVGEEWKVEMALVPSEESRVGIGLSDREPPDQGTTITLRLLYRSASGVRYQTSHHLEVGSQAEVTRLDFRRSLAPGRH